jgi:branched-chain amino acid transport system substrate-binding protein
MQSVAALRCALVLSLAVAFAVLPPLPVRAADPFDIYVVLPLTGFAAFLGQGEAKGFAVLTDVVNKQGGIRGRPVRFVLQDDQSSPQVTLQLTNAIVAKNVPVMFGSTITAMCQAQTPVLKNGPVDWCLSPIVRPPSGSFVFTTFQETNDYVEACLRYAKGRGWTKLAVVSTTDASGQEFDASFDHVFAKPQFRGVTIAAREHFAITDLSAAAQMTHIKSGGAQAIVGWITGTALGTLLHAENDAGIDLPLLSTPANLSYDQLRGLASVMPSNMLFPATAPYAPNMLPPGRVKQIVFEYLDAMRAHGINPDQATLAPWTPVLITIEALRKYGTDAKPEQIRAFLASYKGSGVLGDYDFVARPQRGVDASTVVMARWDKQRDMLIAVSKFGGDPIK